MSVFDLDSVNALDSESIGLDSKICPNKALNTIAAFYEAFGEAKALNPPTLLAPVRAIIALVIKAKDMQKPVDKKEL